MPQDEDAEQETGPRATGETPAPAAVEDRVSHVLRTFREEPTLWPVGLVVFLSTSSFGALILHHALRLRGLVAGIALVMLIFLSVYHLDPDIRARRLRPASAALLAFWLGSAMVALILNWIGAFP